MSENLPLEDWVFEIELQRIKYFTGELIEIQKTHTWEIRCAHFLSVEKYLWSPTKFRCPPAHSPETPNFRGGLAPSLATPHPHLAQPYGCLRLTSP